MDRTDAPQTRLLAALARAKGARRARPLEDLRQFVLYAAGVDPSQPSIAAVFALVFAPPEDDPAERAAWANLVRLYAWKGPATAQRVWTALLEHAADPRRRLRVALLLKEALAPPAATQAFVAGKWDAPVDVSPGLVPFRPRIEELFRDAVAAKEAGLATAWLAVLARLPLEPPARAALTSEAEDALRSGALEAVPTVLLFPPLRSPLTITNDDWLVHFGWANGTQGADPEPPAALVAELTDALVDAPPGVLRLETGNRINIRSFARACGLLRRIVTLPPAQEPGVRAAVLERRWDDDVVSTFAEVAREVRDLQGRPAPSAVLVGLVTALLDGRRAGPGSEGLTRLAQRLGIATPGPPPAATVTAPPARRKSRAPAFVPPGSASTLQQLKQVFRRQLAPFQGAVSSRISWLDLNRRQKLDVGVSDFATFGVCGLLQMGNSGHDYVVALPSFGRPADAWLLARYDEQEGVAETFAADLRRWFPSFLVSLARNMYDREALDDNAAELVAHCDEHFGFDAAPLLQGLCNGTLTTAAAYALTEPGSVVHRYWQLREAEDGRGMHALAADAPYSNAPLSWLLERGALTEDEAWTLLHRAARFDLGRDEDAVYTALAPLVRARAAGTPFEPLVERIFGGGTVWPAAAVFFAAAEQYEEKDPRRAFTAYENALFLERCETEELHVEALRRLHALAKRIGDKPYLSALAEVKWPRHPTARPAPSNPSTSTG